ncbi:MAG TPA: NADH-quinone oxidoreductase subunit NuoH, partial [Dehalococcoidales bacterium]|nr:NADH-quinone oxidoreductase subunit NuoH [Dehalococcoidales bacterium]
MNFIPAPQPEILQIALRWPSAADWLHWLLYFVIILSFVFGSVMGFIWFERRSMARMQSRLGPNRAGPFGVFQPVADVIKVLTKEDIIPSRADRLVHFLAPIVAFVPVLLIFAVIPFANGAMMADLNVGVLFLVAMGSITGVGLFMAGWGSNNKYSLLGAMRDIAAVISYEIPLVLALAAVVLLAGSMSMNEIVLKQNLPFILFQPLGFVLFFLAGSAEINRTPFDMLEADSELASGYNTEYSGMKFAMFYLVEYAEALALAAIISTLYLGGWKGPLLPPFVWLLIKVALVFFVMVWIRATLPRVRIDQLMDFSWKFMLPMAVANLLITAGQVLLFPDLPWILVLVNFILAAVLVFLWSKFLKI